MITHTSVQKDNSGLVTVNKSPIKFALKVNQSFAIEQPINPRKLIVSTSNHEDNSYKVDRHKSLNLY